MQIRIFLAILIVHNTTRVASLSPNYDMLDILQTHSNSANFSTSEPDTLHLRLRLFGDSCNRTADCLGPLVCSSAVHQCSCPTDRIPRGQQGTWTAKLGITCVLRAGSVCTENTKARSSSPIDSKQIYMVKNGSRTFGKFFWNGLGLSRIVEESECVDNSRCHPVQDVCTCNTGFYQEQKTGLCLQKKAMFQLCTSTSECREEDALVCNRGKSRCECPPHLLFDIRTLKCHIPAGEPCLEFSPAQQEECVPNAECLENICSCKFGFRKSADGTCGLDHGLPCGEEWLCSQPMLSCRSGRCRCKYSSHQVYDDGVEECRGKVSAPCDLSPLYAAMERREILSCVENAVCHNRSVDGDHSGSECRCKEFYAEDTDGKCSKSFGARCDVDAECDSSVGLLACIDGKCSCPDALQQFDPEIRQCRGLIGSRCSTNSSIHETFREHGIPNQCISNGFCNQPVDGLDGRCSCKPGYESMKTRFCKRKSAKFIYGWDDKYPPQNVMFKKDTSYSKLSKNDEGDSQRNRKSTTRKNKRLLARR